MIVSVDLPPVMAARLQEEADTLQEPLEIYLKLLIAQAMPKPRNGNELVERLTEAGILGMWADRDDIVDNLEFARQLRKQAETRNHEA